MLLKIYTADKIFGKICLKAIRATFFFNIYMWSVIRERKGNWGHIQQKGKVQTFSISGAPPLQYPPSV